MNVEKLNQEPTASRILQEKSTAGSLQLEDGRDIAAKQAGLTEAIQRVEDEEEMLQGKFPAQREAAEDEEELLQGKFDVAQQREAPNQTGIPDEVKNNMEASFGTDFSDVRVHPDSSQAPEVGALAYTQGTDIHFAPGQFKPDTQTGQQLLGHELTHVIQQAEGRVQPTTEISGMPVNDDVSLETEADIRGYQAAKQ